LVRPHQHGCHPSHLLIHQHCLPRHRLILHLYLQVYNSIPVLSLSPLLGCLFCAELFENLRGVCGSTSTE
jgi:hypothetical protein